MRRFDLVGLALMASTAAHIAPEVLRWARTSMGLGLEQAASKVGMPVVRLEAAEAGERLLTMRQAEKAAAAYERPLAALFVAAPPEEEAPAVSMRRLRDAPELPWPPEMVALHRRVASRQEAASEVLELLEDEPQWPTTAAALEGAVRPTDVVRDMLGIGRAEQLSWRDARGFKPLRAWIDAVEELGVLVMQDGSLEVEVLRGLAVTHPLAPVIVLNTNDDPRARVFSLMHELGHLLLAAQQAEPSDVEGWCDQFAGRVLMHDDWLREEARTLRGRAPLDVVDALALRFGVTPLAAATRAWRLNVLSLDVYREVVKQLRLRPRPQSASGGDYYLVQLARMGGAYVRLVLAAADAQVVTLSSASSMLGVKVNNFDGLREVLAGRGGG